MNHRESEPKRLETILHTELKDCDSKGGALARRMMLRDALLRHPLAAPLEGIEAMLSPAEWTPRCSTA
jgi:hypothetical protein